ncbi:MAG: flavodoxin family protein [Candidatus Nanohaloarchaea archaeon]|nr:flavodoxin family protein [Candidatus Nanohaloarchaea archaeon]
MSLKAIFLNCTLKESPKTSNTRALIDKSVEEFHDLGVETEVLRPVDYNIEFGVTSDEGEEDEWPQILDKIKESDILVIGTPIWFGLRSSVAQLVMERLDGTYEEMDPETGQFPLYNTVGGVIVTGNEDGAHETAASTLFNLSHLGCTIPPNADSYWVGKAGPGPSYRDAGGENHMYTNKTVRFMTHNLYHFAERLQEKPIDTNLNELIEEAKKDSGECPEDEPCLNG